MAGNKWKELGISQKCLELDANCWKWWEIADLAGNGWKQPEMDKIYNNNMLEWLKTGKNGCKQMKMARNGLNSPNG